MNRSWSASSTAAGETLPLILSGPLQSCGASERCNARTLCPRSLRQNGRDLPDPYVSLLLLPDKNRGTKRKTSQKKKTLDPEFNERSVKGPSHGEQEGFTWASRPNPVPFQVRVGAAPGWVSQAKTRCVCEVKLLLHVKRA